MAILAGGIGFYAWWQSYPQRVHRILLTIEPEKRPWYLEWLGDPDEPAAKEDVIESLVALGPGAEDAIASHLEDKDDDACYCAAAALTELGTSRSVKALIQGLKTAGDRFEAEDHFDYFPGDQYFQTRALMLLALGRTGDARASEYLLDYYRDTNIALGNWSSHTADWGNVVRAEAIWLIGDPNAAVLFAQAVAAGAEAEAEDALRSNTINQLMRIAQLHGYEGVRAALEHSDPNVARASARLLADCADERVTRRILQMIEAGELTYESGVENFGLPVAPDADPNALFKVAIHDGRWWVRGIFDSHADGVRRLECLADNERVLSWLRNLAKKKQGSEDEEPEVLEAALVLAEVRPTEGAGILREILSTWGGQTYFDYEYRIANVLCDTPGRAATEALAYRYLRSPVDPDNDLRRSLWARHDTEKRYAAALLARGDTAAVGPLVEALGPVGDDLASLTVSREQVVALLWKFREADPKRSDDEKFEWDDVEKRMIVNLVHSLEHDIDDSKVSEALAMCDRSVVVAELIAGLGRKAVRQACIEVLARLKATEAVSQCLQIARSSESPELRRKAIDYLARAQAPEAVQVSLKALDDKEVLVRAAAGWALARLGDPSARNKVVATLRDANSRPADADQAAVLARYLGPQQTLELMQAAWDVNSWPGWHEGMVLATAEQERDRCVAMVMRIVGRRIDTKDPNALAARRPALRCAAKLKAPQVAALLDEELKLINDLNYSDKWNDGREVLRLLADVATPESFAYLHSYLREYPWPVDKDDTVLELIRLKHPSAWDSLLKLRVDERGGGGANARMILDAMRASGDFRAARDRIATLLGTRSLREPSWWGNDSDSMAILCHYGFVEALEMAGDPRGAELLGKMLAEPRPVYCGGSGSFERRHATAALGRMKSPAAGPALRKLLKDHRRSVRYYAAEQLGRRRDKQALPLLREMLNHPDARLQYAAKKAIQRIEAPGP